MYKLLGSLLVLLFTYNVTSVQHFRLLTTLPHDPKAFTQGLQYYNGLLYESTGMYGDSDVRIVHPDTGEVLKRQSLGRQYFGEGLVVIADKIFILTWKEKTMLVFDSTSLQVRCCHMYFNNISRSICIICRTKLIPAKVGVSPLTRIASLHPMDPTLSPSGNCPRAIVS